MSRISTLILVTLILALSCGATTASRLLKRKPDPTNIWDLIQSRQTQDLRILSQLVQSAGLVPMLNVSSKAGPLTMLMPVDTAFESFFQEMGSNLTDMIYYNHTVQEVLLYHLIPSVLTGGSLRPNLKLTTVLSFNITVSRYWDDSMSLRDEAGRTARILEGNLPAGLWSTGVTVDRVLFPYRPATVGEALKYDKQFSMFADMLQDTGFDLNSSSAAVTLLVPTNDAVMAALETLNLTYAQLAANKTLINNIADVHVLPVVYSWQALLQVQGSKWITTSSPCASFVVFQEEDGALVLNGGRLIEHATARVVDADRYAGTRALIQVVDAVMLPLAKMDGQCAYPTARPPAAMKPSPQ